MKKLLYIQSSPRAGKSISLKLADAFIEEYKERYPDAVIDVIQLWDAKLP